jgi:hypothetical protein
LVRVNDWTPEQRRGICQNEQVMACQNYKS